MSNRGTVVDAYVDGEEDGDNEDEDEEEDKEEKVEGGDDFNGTMLSNPGCEFPRSGTGYRGVFFATRLFKLNALVFVCADAVWFFRVTMLAL